MGQGLAVRRQVGDRITSYNVCYTKLLRIGVLYLRRGTRFRPLLRGGHQERGRRAGTENAASIVGLGVACERALEFMEHENTEVKRLRAVVLQLDWRFGY